MQNVYDDYYWQNKKVRLRLSQPTDDDNFDSTALALVHEEVVLPSLHKNKADEKIDGSSTELPSFSIENFNGDYIGHIHFNHINERHGTFSISLIIKKEYRSKGYGKAALRILLEYAFNERRLHKFNGFCLDDNVASAKVMEALGCTLEGVVRDAVFMNGKYHNQYLYGITESEYNSM